MSDVPLKFGEAGFEIQRLREENQHIRGAYEDCRAQWTQMATHNAEQAAEITRLCALVAETGALAARRAAMLEASEERERAIELRFWQIVDRDGLTGLPSDMWAALDQLVKDRAELATARRDGMEEAAKIAEDEPELPGQMPSEFEKYSRETLARAACIATKRGIVAAIRAAAGEGK